MQAHRISKERGQHRILEVEAGQVVCPRQGIVDMERCWVCPAYDGLSAGWIEGVVCKANLAELSLYPLPSIRDGSEAIAHVETRISEVACAYPITPSTTMAAVFQSAVAAGHTNLWGTPSPSSSRSPSTARPPQRRVSRSRADASRTSPPGKD